MPFAPDRSIVETIPKRSNQHKPKELLHTHRLPQDTVELLYPHVFPYQLTTSQETRSIHIPTPHAPLWEYITKGGSMALSLFPNAIDEHIAEWLANNIRILLSQDTTIKDSRMGGSLSPAKMAISCAAHTSPTLRESTRSTCARDPYRYPPASTLSRTRSYLRISSHQRNEASKPISLESIQTLPTYHKTSYRMYSSL
jgi:hypothetical protein